MALNEITPMHVGSVIGVILFVLGFFALMAQRIYIDPQTNAPSEIEVPILGKMKANYPALVFAFLGAVIVIVGFSKHEGDDSVSWLIDGEIISDTPGINWRDGQLAIFPENTELEINETGQFRIKHKIKKGRTVEDVIERIQYTNPAGTILIVPKDALEQHSKHGGGNSVIAALTSTSRKYRVQFQAMPQ